MTSFLSEFQENGYIIVKDCIPHSLIDECLCRLDEVKKRPNFRYYTQSTHRWTKPLVSESGFLIESVLNPTQHLHAPRLAKAVSNIIYSESIYKILTILYPGHYDFVSWQDMLFDQSTATVAHVDTWYLDTEKKGGLIGIWIALEDISIKSGAFYVYEKSHKYYQSTEFYDIDHKQFIADVSAQTIQGGYKKKSMLIQKGDVVCWHSCSVHGSDISMDSRFSRKSITTHYYPLGMRRRDAGDTMSLYKDLSSLAQTNHPRLHRLRKRGRHPVFYTCSAYVFSILNTFGYLRHKAWNMRSDRVS